MESIHYGFSNPSSSASYLEECAPRDRQNHPGAEGAGAVSMVGAG